MYDDVLYTITPPRVGQSLEGQSRTTGDVVATCPVRTFRRMEAAESRDTYLVRTVHGGTFLVIVLPADLESARRGGYARLFRSTRNPAPACPQGQCACQSEVDKTEQTARVFREIRRMMFWLAALSLLLGSPTLFSSQLWTMFTTFVNTVLIEHLKLLLTP